MFGVECNVRRFDVHEGDGGRRPTAAIILALFPEDFYTLNTSKPSEIFLDPILTKILWQVSHPEMSCFTHHDLLSLFMAVKFGAGILWTAP